MKQIRLTFPTGMVDIESGHRICKGHTVAGLLLHTWLEENCLGHLEGVSKEKPSGAP